MRLDSLNLVPHLQRVAIVGIERQCILAGSKRAFEVAVGERGPRCVAVYRDLARAAFEKLATFGRGGRRRGRPRARVPRQRWRRQRLEPQIGIGLSPRFAQRDSNIVEIGKTVVGPLGERPQDDPRHAFGEAGAYVRQWRRILVGQPLEEPVLQRAGERLLT